MEVEVFERADTRASAAAGSYMRIWIRKGTYLLKRCAWFREVDVHRRAGRRGQIVSPRVALCFLGFAPYLRLLTRNLKPIRSCLATAV